MVMEEPMDGEMSLSNMVLGFFEEADRERWPENVDDDEGSSGDDAESKAFWQAQRSQLHEALAKASPAESRIRADTEEAIKNMRAAAACSCTGRAPAGDCRRCMLRHVAERLRDAGYNSALCKSKWTRSPDIPSGEHSYVDVVVQTRSGKAVRVVVELSFRAEFEVARASAGYRALVTALPEVFVGRADRLRAVVKVMCAAAKQCMKENNMHMGPWRKHKYMQSKWLGTHERTTAAAAAVATPAVPAVVTVGSPEKQTKFRASMLSFDFARTAVEVV
uniref:Plant-specific domain TIGR01615 family protein n=1 Tax=Arundo donax TaxID=35708 RepID=A0A0A9DS47_ARUDO